MEYTYKRFSPSLLNDFLYIYKAAINTSPDETMIRKKFDTARFGAEYIGYIAYSGDNEPAAYYGVFPLLINSPNGKILVAQSGDTMTHPSHRGKGLFKELFFKTEELAGNTGIIFLFGFPNKNSHPGFTKFGWETLFNSNQYALLFPLNFFERIYKKILPARFYVSREQKLDKLKIPLKTLISEAKLFPSQNLQIERNETYLSYKSYSNSFFLKFNSGYAWAKIEGDLFYVGDIFPSKINQTELLLREMIKQIKKMCFSKILFYTSPNSQWNESLSKVLLKKEGVPFILKKLNKDLSFNINFEYTSADFDTF